MNLPFGANTTSLSNEALYDPAGNLRLYRNEGNSTFSLWQSVEIRAAGDFYVCWCSAGACDRRTDYKTIAAEIRIQGAYYKPDGYPAVVGAKTFLSVQGFELRNTDC